MVIIICDWRIYDKVENHPEQMPDQRLGISPAVKNYAGFDLPCGKNGLAKCFYGKKICSRIELPSDRLAGDLNAFLWKNIQVIR